MTIRVLVVDDQSMVRAGFRMLLAGVRWAGLFLLLAAPLGIGFLVLGGVLSPETDLGFWSALSVPYAIARVLLAVFAPHRDDITTNRLLPEVERRSRRS